MGKNGTQLLRHCVHILVRVTSDLFAVRLSGIGYFLLSTLSVSYITWNWFCRKIQYHVQPVL